MSLYLFLSVYGINITNYNYCNEIRTIPGFIKILKRFMFET